MQLYSPNNSGCCVIALESHFSVSYGKIVSFCFIRIRSITRRRPIGLIKGISTFDASKGARLATYAARCVENEILMYFRSQKKTASDVSLSECIETGKDGTSLSLMDVIDSEEDLFEDLSAREMHGKLREIMQQVLTPREREILTLRYGLSNQPPQTQRELAARCGISRSYVSRIEKKALKKLEDALSPFRPDG